jgi:hypothetical protein
MGTHRLFLLGRAFFFVIVLAVFFSNTDYPLSFFTLPHNDTCDEHY